MLPVHEALPDLKASLRAGNAAVLVAPPGAGKTTVVPLELLAEPWVAGGKIIVLEPRRLAARAAAERMAATLGERVGDTVGYRVRLQSRISAATRIEVVTEGVFTRMVLGDPELPGVACVIFDEFHERSLDADLGLALARDAQRLLREDLRLLVMSATLDGAAVARLLDGAAVIESLGRMFPVETRYLGRDAPSKDGRLRIEDQAVRAVERALAEETGSLLVFLPGQGEILRTAERLRERNRPNVEIAPLYGALDPRDQDRAIAPAPTGKRKVVLATSIAETSLTIQGVRVVIDCGVARVPRYDPASGLTRLATVRVSRAAADQRRGRAGRTEPGVCYRLWDEAETRALPAYADPEILDADLSGLALDLARWGAKDATDLAFLDPPPSAAFTEARALLQRLEALNRDGVLTAHGRALADMPLNPRLAHMVLKAADTGQAPRAARIAALITERGLGGRDADLRHRLDGLERDRGPRARDAKALAERWAGLSGRAGKGEALSDGLLLAFAYPERVAKARGGQGEFQLVTGRGAFVDPTDALAREPWLAVAELGGGDRRDRVLLAAPLEPAELVAFKDQFEIDERLEESGSGRLRAKRLTRLGRLTIREEIDDNPDPALIARALTDRVRREGVKILPWGEAATSLRERAAFLQARDPAWPDLSDEALAASLDDWLAPVLLGLRGLNALKPDVLDGALRTLVPWDLQRRLDAEAPVRWTAPTGNSFTIDYAAEAGPRVDVRVQEVFGLAQHPTIGGTPITMSLLSPGHRPIQTTQDLPGFWKGSWKDVRSDMRGRYPKHVWPEDPSTAAPTARAKPRGT
ncbi:MAG: ATP-dependent helicase HrpB [Alphaproteobacteria bacterium]|nr:ATP-dependent helicase HrpB [Alphaproteobacteria bacterium]MBU1512877.1 ATP-dependent helicase HrpB [Alphaproteobacteria bacterium]MBU2096682.1 ATP-dependent helicase HrpB [Alphaproteobacteria bacterium]MBU2308063.1 ATP-dependent helicase HrpB [Alphaproteobacteria bacterium]MBU2365434.1 ATP-dependent helicase HrpB [Alphaproteobacteria bacterium]